MRLLVDENIPGIIVQWLRSEGHDVELAGLISPGESDDYWIRHAEDDSRIMLTSDKDFGELVFRERMTSHGIILLRFLDLSLAERLDRLQEVWSVIEANPQGRFIVVTPTKIRVRPL
jgi:predicted nuclease of predicted toxin-antitoxin system